MIEGTFMRRLMMIAGFISLYLLIPQATFSQESQPKFSCRISLDITADDKIKGEISSYISRELRSLGDVVITGTDPALKIEIVALEVNSGNSSVGYAISVLVSKPIDSFALDLIASAPSSSEDKQFMRGVYLDYRKLVSHFVQTGPHSDLPLTCKKIVTTIDSDAIEGERKMWQTLQDYRKKNPQFKPIKPE
jgi:hypothetical protein